jgi:hypothetical protein
MYTFAVDTFNDIPDDIVRKMLEKIFSIRENFFQIISQNLIKNYGSSD